MVTLFALHIIFFSAFSLGLTALPKPTRAVYFYSYISIILLIGGFLGNAYSLPLSDEIMVSGGNIVYGAFMMTSIMFVLVERDIFILWRLIQLVLIVDFFNILLSKLITLTYAAPETLNPHATPSALFSMSVPLIVLGGVLIIVELGIMLYIFEQIKRLRLSPMAIRAAYLVIFVAILGLDGIVFPLIAFGMSPQIVGMVIGGMTGKLLTAASYGLTIVAFMALFPKRFSEYLEAKIFNWKTLQSTSSEIIHELERNQEGLIQAESVFRNSDNGLAIVSDKGGLVRANHAFRDFLGATDLADNSQCQTLLATRLQAAKGDPFGFIAPLVEWRGEVLFGENLTRKGLLSVTRCQGVQEAEPTFVYSLSDISELKKHQARLAHLARHDQLTGLLNRRALDQRLQAMDGDKLSVLVLDLDFFKDVNDSHGHFAGDLLLKQVADRLQKFEKSIPDLSRGVFRVGGDEFCIMLGSCNWKEVRAVIDEIRNVLTPIFLLPSGIEARLQATMGVSISHDSPTEVFQQADAALYDAKQNAKGGYSVFHEGLKQASQRKLELSLKLAQALEDQALEVYYQPQISLQTGLIVGVEALVRWQDADFGSVSPTEFIPIAEEYGLIAALGEYVFVRACRDQTAWQRAASDPIRISVNVSPLQLRQPGLAEMVRRTLEDAKLPAGRLQLELTETAFVGREEEMLPILTELKSIGVSLALDDFGTGYSSLSYLTTLPWDMLKIDRSFVARMTEGEDSAKLVASIIEMAQSISLRVVAEGVETSAQEKFLRQMQCEEAQGFLFSKGLPATEIGALISDWRSDCIA